MPGKKVIIIGSGFAGMSAACFMANAGWKVTVLEKNNQPGGRAGKLEVQGFTFDMGPSWYWMPEVFEKFFQNFGHTVSDFYTLSRLDPSYRVYWPDGPVDIPANKEKLKALFETIEVGSAKKLELFLQEAEYKYRTGMEKLVFKPGLSVAEFIDWDVIKGVFKLDIFSSMKKHVAAYFTNPRLKELMEFPVLFLGAMAADTPALYSLMNYADIVGGTWYPHGGMYKVVEAMHTLATKLGVEFLFDHSVKSININNGYATSVTANGIKMEADAIIAGADYHHVETNLLPEAYRSYSKAYWESRVMAPGCLLYFVGLDKKLANVKHHSLFFDVPFKPHADEIYKSKVWPKEPLFYVSATSITDETTAPKGCENLFFLIPVAAGLINDTEALRDEYFNNIVERFEKQTGENIKEHITYKKSYAHSNFIQDYNSFKGNAYGMANTLRQTAVLKPSIRSKKVANLFYTGQLTVPGPGVPPSLISGEVVANEVIKKCKL